MKRYCQQGFTLVELVTVLALTAIVATFASYFIAVPVQGYTDLSRRAALVDRAENALQRVGRDLRRALPNSVRIRTNGSIVAVEFLDTLDGVRYRAGPPPSDPNKELDFSAADNAFNSVGPFSGITKPFSSTAVYLSIYNVGVSGANAYELANVITPPGTQIDIVADAIANEDNVTVTPPFQFAYASPGQRLFLVAGPVSYLCDPVGGTLTRYAGYAIASDHSTRDSSAELLAAGATGSMISDAVSGCDFSYAAGAAQRAGLVSARLEVADSGERVALLHQVHVMNVP
ncbi:MAG: prepilin-type N-terminal cleavage/methylation domain-containing protein [Gammaproteobacteria bacterium]|nr:prepilin-type N-terminal cleavage/methylation domain-containing protein [Gammaproteobacteria bacterium]